MLTDNGGSCQDSRRFQKEFILTNAILKIDYVFIIYFPLLGCTTEEGGSQNPF